MLSDEDLKAYCAEAGVKFYDSELVSENARKIYRIYILKKGGVSLEDCARLSEILSPILDVKPPCAGEYFLEVSSPGLERKLSKIEHFRLSLGELVKISTTEKEKIEGKIMGVKDDFILIKPSKIDENTEFSADENLLEIPFSHIKRARTFVMW